MAQTITLIPTGEAGERILDEFESRTGLVATGGADGGRAYPIEGEDHRIKIIETLDEIDLRWVDRVALGEPS